MSAPLANHTSTLLNEDGDVLLAGGDDPDGNVIASAELYTMEVPLVVISTSSLAVILRI
jgi:hypothetical protein